MDNFRSLLLSLSYEIGEGELESMKFACKSHIGAGILERLNLPVHLFSELEQRNLLGPENKGFLVDLLVKIGRRDLTNKLLGIQETEVTPKYTERQRSDKATREGDEPSRSGASVQEKQLSDEATYERGEPSMSDALVQGRTRSSGTIVEGGEPSTNRASFEEPAITTETMARCNKSVGMISLKSTDNESPKYVATAWIISKKENEAYIMTNYHVISAAKNRKKAAQKKTKLVIQFDYRVLAQPICPEFEVQMLENEISNDNLDYAILKVNDNIPGKETLKVTRRLPDNDFVFIIGFPNAEPKKRISGKLQRGIDVENWVKENTSNRCPVHPCNGSNKNVECQHNYDWSKFKRRKEFLLVHNCGTDHGSSGSPILNNSGEVCGMHCWGLYLGDRKKWPNPLFEFGHNMRHIIDDIKKKDETFAIKLFGKEFLQGLGEKK